MKTKTPKSAKVKAAIRVKTLSVKGDVRTLLEDNATHVTEVRIKKDVEVGTRDNYLCFWTQGREVRIGPLSKEQAETLSDDLAYEALN